MTRSIKIAIYYIIIKHLPHSRYSSLSNKIRTWYMSKVLKIMKYSKQNYFENNIYFGDGKNVSIGEQCHINENVFIQSATIGNYVMIAPNVSILSKSHIHADLNIPMIKQGESEHKKVIINNNVWIGRNAIILPGVEIAEGCIIAAGSVVTKSSNPFTIIGGVPAKLIKKRS